jgi:hypothetical protein
LKKGLKNGEYQMGFVILLKGNVCSPLTTNVDKNNDSKVKLRKLFEPQIHERWQSIYGGYFVQDEKF